MTDAREEKKRRFFDRIEAVIVAGFVVFATAIFLGTAAIPRLAGTAEGAEALRKRGYRPSVTRYSDIRFSDDDTTVVFRSVESWQKDSDRMDAPLKIDKTVEVAVPRGPRAPGKATDPGLRDDILRTLLVRHQFVREMFYECAVSHDGRDIAYLQTLPSGNDAVLFRQAAGGYRNLSGGPLPPGLSRLHARPLAARLASAEETEWADGAIESLLTDGPTAAIFANRLAVEKAGMRREMLIRIIAKIGRAADLDDAVAAVATVADSDAKTRILKALSSPPDPGDSTWPQDGLAVDEPRVLEAMLKQKWADTDPVWVAWLLQPLEEGWVAKLPPAYFAAAPKSIGQDHAKRLAPIIEGKRDLEAAAAAWILKGAGGTPPKASDAAELRKWFAAFKTEHPELF